MRSFRCIVPVLFVISLIFAFNTNLPSSDSIRDLESTEELYKNDEFVFVGDFIESRSKVDFNHHRNYKAERQLLQDSIVHKYLKFGKSVNSPKIIFMAGVMGAGKGYVLNQMDRAKEINLNDYLLIDPDQLKDELPEMAKYVALDPQTAGTKVHKESGFIQEIILSEGLKLNKNIIVDGSLTHLLRHKMLFELIHREYPQYEIEIIHVIADLETVQKRIQSRGDATGRYVPMEKVKEVYEKIPKTVEALTPLVSRVVVIHNN
jgi:predicted ABC-type ATPase